MSKPFVLVVDDEPDIRDLVKEILEDEGYAVETAESATAARAALRTRTPELVLLDIWMPEEDGITLLKDWAASGALRFPVVMISGHGTVETAVEATRLGAVDFVEKPLSMAKLLVTVDQALKAGLPGARTETSAVEPEGIEPVGRSRGMQHLREQARRIAGSDSWVLVTGEAGAGKRCFARYIHALSGRSPRVELAAGSIAGEAAAEELYGSEHNGRVTKGRLEAATGGTLIIDEVADLDAMAQKRLVSAIEEGGFQRHGGAQRVPLDTRIIALTRKDLPRAVQQGRFREDLYYHLNVVPVAVPALRDHVEDVPELLSFYVDHLVEREHLPYRRFTVAAQNRLRNHGWPGNVRELRNLVQRLLILGEGLDITVDEVERTLARHEAPPEVADAVSGLSLDMPLREAREAFERLYLQHQLQRADGSVAQLARLTGMERTHLYRKLRALGLHPKEGG